MIDEFVRRSEAVEERVTENNCDCKVGRISRKHQLSGIHQDLLARRFRDEDRYSLRQLAAYFNQRVLFDVLETYCETPLHGETENLYELLTGQETSKGTRIYAENRLKQHGVDVDELRADFVSYQTINRHLKNCLDVDERDTGHAPDEDEIVERVQSLRHRTTAVTEDAVDQLQRNDEISLDVSHVNVDINIVCNCGKRWKVDQLLEDGGCDCTRGARVSEQA